jgi:hypothetical protein
MKSPSIEVRSPSVRRVPDRVRNASGRVKVWAQERTARRTYETSTAEESTNPLHILAAIYAWHSGFATHPAGWDVNPGVQDNTFVTVLSFLVLSAFVTAVVFEIKRLVDQLSNQNGH